MQEGSSVMLSKTKWAPAFSIRSRTSRLSSISSSDESRPILLRDKQVFDNKPITKKPCYTINVFKISKEQKVMYKTQFVPTLLVLSSFPYEIA